MDLARGRPALGRGAQVTLGRIDGGYEAGRRSQVEKQPLAGSVLGIVHGTPAEQQPGQRGRNRPLAPHDRLVVKRAHAVVAPDYQGTPAEQPARVVVAGGTSGTVAGHRGIPMPQQSPSQVRHAAPVSGPQPFTPPIQGIIDGVFAALDLG